MNIKLPALLSSLVTLFLLAGCAAPSQPYSEAPRPLAGKGIVYLYRTKAFAGGGRDVHCSIDGRRVADLMGGKYTWAHLSPGAHTFVLDWGSSTNLRPARIEHPFTISSGGTAYFRVSTFLGAPAPIISLSGMQNPTWNFEAVPASQARSEIAQCRYESAP